MSYTRREKRLFVNSGGVARRVERVQTCTVLQDCGACALIDEDYRVQLQEKEEDLKRLLATSGDALKGIAVRSCVPSPQTLGYRHTAKLVVSDKRTPGGAGKRWIQVGLYKPTTHQVVDIGRCPVQSDRINELLSAVRTEIRKQEITTYDERSRKGLLRYVVVKQSKTTGEMLLTLVVTAEEKAKLKAFARALAGQFPHLRGVLAHVNSASGNAIFRMTDDDGGDEGGNTIALTGYDSVTETVCGLKLRYSASSFMQINPQVAEKAYYRIGELAALRPGERVLDLYCGTGAISLLLAKTAASVVGLEENAASVADATANATANGLTSAIFHAGRVEEILPNLIKGGAGALPLVADVVVMNPSRRGCQRSVLGKVAELKPRAMIYMSCNPKTLLRDLEILAEKGYRTSFLEPFDMFPRTRHYEVLAYLEAVT